MAPVNTYTPNHATLFLASRLRDATHELSTRWVDRVMEAVVTSGRPLPPKNELVGQSLVFLAEIADGLSLAPVGTPHVTPATRAAADLGSIRFKQGATVYQLLLEYNALADVLEEFVLHEAAKPEANLTPADALLAMRRVTQTIRALQHQTVSTYVAIYTDAVERQAAQLVGFSQLVGREMRQPLSVLQVIPAMLPVREGDMEFTHLLTLFDRNIRRLAKVAARLERLSHSLHDGMTD
jgi:hypothetical protein